MSDGFGIENGPQPAPPSPGGAAAPIMIQSSTPVGGGIAFAAELYIGSNNAYSYGSGGAGFLPGVVFASTLKRIMFRCAPIITDVTVRLRTAAGVQLYSKLLAAGQVLIDEVVNIAVAAGVLVQLSVEPSSGSPNMDSWHFGWTREIT